MKKLFYLVAGLLWSLSAVAQVQNLDFEQWDHPFNQNGIAFNVPTGWACNNRYFGTEYSQFSVFFRDPVDTLANSRKYALRLFTWYNYMKDAALQQAAFQQRPKALRGVYKYEQNYIHYGETELADTAQVMVLLSKWNSNFARRDTIGFGLFSAPDSVKEFTAFRVNIEYRSTATPDTITIFLDPSIIGRNFDSEIQTAATGGSSMFTLDRLSLTDEDPTAVPTTVMKRELSLFPNPAQGRIYFQSLSGDASITDVNGRVVYRERLRNSNSMELHDLNAGFYLLQINTDGGVFTSRFLKR